MHVKIVKIETSKSMILKFIKYPKIQIKTISKKLSENLRINLNFYESQKYGTHTKKKQKNKSSHNKFVLCSNFICFIKNFTLT